MKHDFQISLLTAAVLILILALPFSSFAQSVTAGGLDVNPDQPTPNPSSAQNQPKAQTTASANQTVINGTVQVNPSPGVPQMATYYQQAAQAYYNAAAQETDPATASCYRSWGDYYTCVAQSFVADASVTCVPPTCQPGSSQSTPTTTYNVNGQSSGQSQFIQSVQQQESALQQQIAAKRAAIETQQQTLEFKRQQVINRYSAKAQSYQALGGAVQNAANQIANYIQQQEEQKEADQAKQEEEEQEQDIENQQKQLQEQLDQLQQQAANSKDYNQNALHNDAGETFVSEATGLGQKTTTTSDLSWIIGDKKEPDSDLSWITRDPKQTMEPNRPPSSDITNQLNDLLH